MYVISILATTPTKYCELWPSFRNINTHHFLKISRKALHNLHMYNIQECYGRQRVKTLETNRIHQNEFGDINQRISFN